MSFAASSPILRPADLEPHTVAQGYDYAAEHYDAWAWQSFWRANEFPVVRDILVRAKPKRGLLDVGAGTGAFLEYVVDYLDPELPLTGVDISTGMLQHARARLGARARLLVGDVQNRLPFDSNSFDAVTMMRVTNHLANLDNAVSEIGRILEPGGTLIATDLAQEFEYVCTRIDTPSGTINFETHKHDREAWRQALTHSGFAAPDMQLFNYSDLRDRLAGHLTHKLAHKDTPIFHVVAARKNSV